jgi:hypothetical protein
MMAQLKALMDTLMTLSKSIAAGTGNNKNSGGGGGGAVAGAKGLSSTHTTWAVTA